MSLYKNYYVIAGYDLTGYSTEEYEDWKWTDEGEKYICFQRPGRIQLFDDPCNGEHMYLGYILVHGDQYNFPTTKFDAQVVEEQHMFVRAEMLKLIRLGVLSEECEKRSSYQVIAFEECN